MAKIYCIGKMPSRNKKENDVLNTVGEIRRLLRDIDSKVEYLIEQNQEHFRCLAGYSIKEGRNT